MAENRQTSWDLSVMLAGRVCCLVPQDADRDQSCRYGQDRGVSGYVPVFNSVFATSTICAFCPGLAWSQIDQIPSGAVELRIRGEATSRVVSSSERASRIGCE